jgi:hypothetical protein
VVDGVVVVAVDVEKLADFGEGESDQAFMDRRRGRFGGWVPLVI